MPGRGTSVTYSGTTQLAIADSPSGCSTPCLTQPFSRRGSRELLEIRPQPRSPVVHLGVRHCVHSQHHLVSPDGADMTEKTLRAVERALCIYCSVWLRRGTYGQVCPTRGCKWSYGVSTGRRLAAELAANVLLNKGAA